MYVCRRIPLPPPSLSFQSACPPPPPPGRFYTGHPSPLLSPSCQCVCQTPPFSPSLSSPHHYSIHLCILLLARKTFTTRLRTNIFHLFVRIAIRDSLLIDCRTRDRKVASLNPGRSGGRIFFSRVSCLCSFLFGARSTPVYLQ